MNCFGYFCLIFILSFIRLASSSELTFERLSKLYAKYIFHSDEQMPLDKRILLRHRLTSEHLLRLVDEIMENIFNLLAEKINESVTKSKKEIIEENAKINYNYNKNEQKSVGESAKKGNKNKKVMEKKEIKKRKKRECKETEMNKGKAKKELEEGMLTKSEEKLSDGHEGINEGLLLLDFFVDLQQDNEQLTAPFQQEKVRLVDICHYRSFYFHLQFVLDIVNGNRTPKTGDNGLKYCWKVLAKGGKFQRDEKCDRIEAISSGKDGRDEGEQKWLKVFHQEMAGVHLNCLHRLLQDSTPNSNRKVTALFEGGRGDEENVFVHTLRLVALGSKKLAEQMLTQVQHRLFELVGQNKQMVEELKLNWPILLNGIDMMAWLQLFYTNVLMSNSAPTRRKTVIKLNLFAYIQSIDEFHRQNERIRDDWCQLRKEMAKMIDSLDTKIIDSVFENQMNSWLSILYLLKKEIKSEQYTVLNREWSMVNINENNKKGMIDEMGHDWEKAQKLIRDDLTQMHYANLEKFIETRMDFRQTFQGGDDPAKAVKLIRKCRQIEGVTKWFLAVHKPQFEQCFNTFNDNYQDSKAVSLSRSYEQLLLDADLFKNQFEFAHAFYSKPIVVDALLWLFSTLVDDLLMFVDGMFGLESGGYGIPLQRDTVVRDLWTTWARLLLEDENAEKNEAEKLFTELTQKQNFGLLHTRTIYTLMKRSKRLSNFFCFHAENIAYAKDRLLMLVNSTANLDWLEMKFPEILKIGVINSRHRIFLYQSILSNRSESRIAQRSKARIVVPFLFEELNTRYQFCFDYEDPSKMQINDDVVNPMWDQFWLSIYPEMDTMKGICLAMFMLQFVDGLAESLAASPSDQQIEDCIGQKARLKQFQRYWELVEQKHLDFLLNGILSGCTILKLFPEGEFPDGTRPRLNKLLGTKLFTAFWHQFGDDIIDKQLFVNDIKLMDNYLVTFFHQIENVDRFAHKISADIIVFVRWLDAQPRGDKFDKIWQETKKFRLEPFYTSFYDENLGDKFRSRIHFLGELFDGIKSVLNKCRNLGIEKKLRQEWVGMEKRALKENLRWMASDARGNAVMPKWIMKLHAKTLQKLAFGSAEKGNEKTGVLAKQFKKKLKTGLCQSLHAKHRLLNFLEIEDIKEIFEKLEIEFKSAGTGILLLSGSTMLKAQTADSDIDTICIVPGHIHSDSFFGTLQCLDANERHNCDDNSLFCMLCQLPEVHSLRRLPETLVPLIRLISSFGHNFEIVFASIPDIHKISMTEVNGSRERICEMTHKLATKVKEGNLKEGEIVKTERMVRSLAAYHSNLMIAEMVPNIETFRIFVLTLKMWAKNNFIYNNVLGFLHGMPLYVLAAKICIMYPNANVPFLLERFFLTYSLWEWPLPVQLAEVRPDLLAWSAEKEQEKRIFLFGVGLYSQLSMPIITPGYPAHNSTFNVNWFTAKIIQKAMQEAFEQLQSSSANGTKWEKLLLKRRTFSDMYEHSFAINCAASSWDLCEEFCGFVGTRIRVQLMKSVECVRGEAWLVGIDLKRSVLPDGNEAAPPMSSKSKAQTDQNLKLDIVEPIVDSYRRVVLGELRWAGVGDHQQTNQQRPPLFLEAKKIKIKKFFEKTKNFESWQETELGTDFVHLESKYVEREELRERWRE
ncbi:hypothetical protein GPALN_003427 [Globodera pallida]|nr:hypothetical protein GPALN_003427 [Globodera pallida]